MTRTKALLASLALGCTALLVGLALAELAARVAHGPPAAAVPRVLFFDAGAFATNACGGVHYAPKRSLRSVAVYDDRIAYDVRFATNDLGYVDGVDYAVPAKPGRRITFVGDSFTAGYHAGGTTWLARLRELAQRTQPDVVLHNLGVDGAGLVHFLRNLRCFEQEVPAGEIVVLFISDDLRRPAWTPRESKDLIQFCYPADCSGARLDVPTLEGRAETQEELVARARFLYEQRWSERPRSAFERLWRASQLVSLLSEARGRLARRAGDADGASLFTPAERAGILRLLQKFRADFGADRLRFLHLPQKPEVARGSYSEDVSGLFREHGLAYVPLLGRCEFSEDGFLELDPHPNERGYAQILACVRRELGF
jgi:hypothetical protein